MSIKVNQMTYLVDGDTVCVVVGAAMGKLAHALDGDLVCLHHNM